MTAPVRLQLSRRRGFNLQEHSLAVNGLGAVNCARPSRWSNPFVIGQPSGWKFEDGGDPAPLIAALSRDQAVEMFETMARGILFPEMHPAGHQWTARLKKSWFSGHPMEIIRQGLGGKNLACWCRSDEACHCDVLLEMANA